MVALRRLPRVWVPRTPFGFRPSSIPALLGYPVHPASQSCQRLPSLFHARARVPDCFELGKVDGLAPVACEASDSRSGRLRSDSVLAQQAAEPVATAEEIELRQLSTWRRL